MRGFPLASAEEVGGHGPCLEAIVDDEEKPRPLYVQIDDELMAFIEEEMRRRRLPGQANVKKQVIVRFGLEMYRQLVALAEHLDPAVLPPEFRRILEYCQFPILTTLGPRRVKAK